jgi:hypothetical protein
LLRDDTVSESHGFAFVQQMRAERDDTIPRFERSNDRGRFVAECGDFDGTPTDPRRFAFDTPYTGTLARIEDRADRELESPRGTPGRDLDRDG